MAASPDSPSQQLLLVEGTDDKHVVLHLCNRSELGLPFTISSRGSVEQVLAAIGPEIKAPDRTTLGILVDANDDRGARWRAVADRLRNAGVQPPAAIAREGAIIEGDRQEGRPRVGVWLMPDNASTGELEDFVAVMIPEGDPVWPRSTDYVAGIPEEDRKFTEGKTRRAEVHAWLAVRREPRRMGAAIGTRDLDIDVPVCRTFVDWLRRLFRE